MNLSGQAVSMAASFYKIAVDSVLIVLDDFALPLGKLRFRTSGSAGGHNGLQSVIDHLGTAGVPRLRIGIGVTEQSDAVGHVLGRFRPEEREALDAAVDRAIAAIECAQTQGITAAMNAFN
jgi:PTH1 family peptidyl-tRNA hydrolase